MRYARRDVLKRGGAAIGAALVAHRAASAQAQTGAPVRSAQTPALNVAYEETGDVQGFPVILLHGFPDDARATRWSARSPSRDIEPSSRICAVTDRRASEMHRRRGWRSRRLSARMRSTSRMR